MTREAYDRFGPEKVEWLKDKRNQAVDSSYDSQVSITAIALEK